VSRSGKYVFAAQRLKNNSIKKLFIPFLCDTCLYPAFHTVQLLLLVACVLASYFFARMWKDTEHDSDRRGQWDQKGGIFTASLYFILSFTGAYYSFKCYQIVKLAANLELNPLNKRRRQKLEKFLFLIPLFFVIFFLRFLWSALYFLNANPLQGLVSKWIKDHNRHSFDDSFI